jgi:thiol:disulfide interchange protein DsbD
MAYVARLSIVLLACWTTLCSATQKVDVALIAEVESVQPGQPFWVGIQQTITPGWHTYWRTPGDSGAATQLHWSLPEGFSASEIHWPFPERILYGPLVNFGYHDEVLLLVQLTPPENIAGEVILTAKAQWLVCEEICIPEDADLSLTLPVVSEEPVFDNRYREKFLLSRQKIPRTLPLPASVDVAGQELSLTVALLTDSRFQSLTYFPYEEGVIDLTAPIEPTGADGGLLLRLSPGWDFSNQSSFDGVLVVTEKSGDQTAFEIMPTVQTSAGIDWLNAVLFAFLGGMILNLMPCVFPVLSIKILSLLESTGSIRLHGLVYFAGVVLSFVFIAAVLLGLREAGEQIGWGFQLQSPIVIALLCYLFVFIGLNLMGYFEIGLSWSNMGNTLVSRDGYLGSFATGVLASVVAAPCTAPFMGAAIGFAMVQDTVIALSVFAALGVGMATPYLALCITPGLLQRLPRPGQWMVTLKQLFAFPMFASAIWLIWVLSIQTGPEGVLYVLLGLLCITFAIWMANLRGGVVYKLIIGLLVLTSLALISNLTTDKTTSSSDFVSYSKAALEEARREGPVFVNFTAAWCITCKVNELVAMQSDKVIRVFDENNVTYMKGDWTNEDPEITAALAEYGRNGVPLYLYFDTGEKDAQILPQILTEDIVIQAVTGR